MGSKKLKDADLVVVSEPLISEPRHSASYVSDPGRKIEPRRIGLKWLLETFATTLRCIGLRCTGADVNRPNRGSIELRIASLV